MACRYSVVARAFAPSLDGKRRASGFLPRFDKMPGVAASAEQVRCGSRAAVSVSKNFVLRGTSRRPYPPEKLRLQDLALRVKLSFLPFCRPAIPRLSVRKF